MRRRAFLLATFSMLSASSAIAASARQPVDLVDPFMGTRGDRGQLSPAAAAPFGMVQLAPDTLPANHIGYDADAAVLLGFSQTRTQGVGCQGGGGDLLTSVRYADEAGPLKIDKTSERAGPGWYAVRYGSVSATLAAGQSVSISRFTASRAGTLVLTLDPNHGYARNAGYHWANTSAADIRVGIDNGTVCNRGTYHLHIASSLRLNGHQIDEKGMVEDAGILTFALAVRAGDTVELRAGLSTVDDQSARATLIHALGDIDIAALEARTRQDWNVLLSRIAVDERDDETRRKLFYTCLFRALQMPARLDDANGDYRTSDGKLAHAPRGHHRYGGWSLWDNYRTQVPLVALIAPDVARDMSDSLIDLFRSGKAQWATDSEPFLTVRTEHAGIALLDLVRKGLGPTDPGAALPAMARETDELPHATPDQRLELAYDEWAVAQLAHDLRRSDISAEFTRRWQSYRPIWTQVFRSLGDDADVVKARGLYQGTLWQYRWAPVFDLPWLRDVALGQKRFQSELTAFFDRRLYNMTNEPDIHVPFLFALTPKPERTDAIVAALRDRPYQHWYDNAAKLSSPFIQPSFSLSQGFADGMDDDGGAMSAWYVWASLGLYPLVPGEPWYVVSQPGFHRVRLNTGGRIMTIERRDGAGKISRVSLNGRLLHDRRISHSALVRGGTLTFEARRH